MTCCVRDIAILELQGGRNKSNHLVFSSLGMTVMNRSKVQFVPKNEQSCSHNRNIAMVAGFSTSGRSRRGMNWRGVSLSPLRQARRQKMRGTAANQRRKDEELCNFRPFIAYIRARTYTGIFAFCCLSRSPRSDGPRNSELGTHNQDHRSKSHTKYV